MANKNLLVTGAASGIGKATALALSAQGHTVFAAALNEAEMAVLAGLGAARLVPVQLDISSVTAIETAITTVSQQLGGQGLDGLVNIAGVNLNAPLHVLTVAEVQQMVNVNLLGTMLLTRAALALLERAKGRVVIVGSATAFLPPPAITIYAATKCGVAGFGDALRMELAMAGMHVSLIEPGVVRTPLTANAPAILERMLSRMSQPDRARYEKLMRKIVAMSASEKVGIPPETVAAAIIDALMSEHPRAHYRVGVDSKAAALLRHLPSGAKDFIQRKTFGI